MFSRQDRQCTPPQQVRGYCMNIFAAASIPHTYPYGNSEIQTCFSSSSINAAHTLPRWPMEATLQRSQLSKQSSYILLNWNRTHAVEDYRQDSCERRSGQPNGAMAFVHCCSAPTKPEFIDLNATGKVFVATSPKIPSQGPESHCTTIYSLEIWLSCHETLEIGSIKSVSLPKVMQPLNEAHSKDRHCDQFAIAEEHQVWGLLWVFGKHRILARHALSN